MSEHRIETGEALVPQLVDWASEHVEKSGGQLGALPYNPYQYPGQDGVSVQGDPQSAAVVDGIATIAQPRYPEITKLLQAHENDTQDVSRIGELLAGGNNVILATNHSDLIDIAVSHAALYGQLDRMGYEPKTGIIISKMVAFLAYRLGEELAPAVEVLKILENETFLSYPRSDSAQKRGVGRLLPSEIERHNRHMRDRVEYRLGEGAMLLAIAPSGTVDKPLPGDSDTMVLGRVGTGTKKVMTHPRTYLLPMAVWYGSETPVFEICDIPRVVRSEEVVTNAMQRIAHTLTERVEEKSFVYEG